uniref:BRCT domain-containing protein n=2 Tax=Trypanosoma congolense (strain IL3000) TaxID=1068625 RepID=G0W2V0_TRYCI|nr:hypothetical protein, T. brucei homolog Tb09.160.0340 [Trypanosoma congolense IL3000]
MSINESDSLWLQKSIHLNDPIPDAADTIEVGAENRPKDIVLAGEDDMRGFSQAPSSAGIMKSQSQRAPSRHSLCDAGFASLQEIDDLRARVSQLTREQLKWSSNQRELDVSRFELAQAQQELQTMREYVKAVKGELEQATCRAERETKKRLEAESLWSGMVSQGNTEKEFLKQQLDATKEEQNRKIIEIEERTQADSYARIELLRGQIENLTEQLEASNEQRLKDRQEVCRLKAENEGLHSGLRVLQEKCEETQRSLESYVARCAELEAIHAEFVEKVERSQAEAFSTQMALNDEHIKEIIASKDKNLAAFQEEVKELKEKNRRLTEDAGAFQHRIQTLEEEARQVAREREKEVTDLQNNHRLLLCQQKMQTDVLIREARGCSLQREEEISSLKRQKEKILEELQAVTAVLAQREKQVSEIGDELLEAKEKALQSEQKIASANEEAEVLRDQLQKVEQRVQHLHEQQDTLQESYSKDMLEMKDRLSSTQEELVRVKKELSTALQDKMKCETESITTVTELRAKLEEAVTDKELLHQRTQEAKKMETFLEQYREKYLAMCKRAENLAIDLTATTNRCSLLERRLDEEFRRSVRNASHSPSFPYRGTPGVRLRSVSSTNALNTVTAKQQKRDRSPDTRFFAITGFDNTDILSKIGGLPHSIPVTCAPNLPLAPNVTHLITNGQLTVKLLTALVRGCWVLPVAYVQDSLAKGKWLDEASYGFRHETSPLFNKRIGFSPKFLTSKHHSTANTIILEGGGIIETNLDAADIVLCSHSECDTLGNVHLMTWDKLLDLIYPQKVGISQ